MESVIIEDEIHNEVVNIVVHVISSKSSNSHLANETPPHESEPQSSEVCCVPRRQKKRDSECTFVPLKFKRKRTLKISERKSRRKRRRKRIRDFTSTNVLPGSDSAMKINITPTELSNDEASCVQGLDFSKILPNQEQRSQYKMGKDLNRSGNCQEKDLTTISELFIKFLKTVEFMKNQVDPANSENVDRRISWLSLLSSQSTEIRNIYSCIGEPGVKTWSKQRIKLKNHPKYSITRRRLPIKFKFKNLSSADLFRRYKILKKEERAIVKTFLSRSRFGWKRNGTFKSKKTNKSSCIMNFIDSANCEMSKEEITTEPNGKFSENHTVSPTDATQKRTPFSKLCYFSKALFSDPSRKVSAAVRHCSENYNLFETLKSRSSKISRAQVDCSGDYVESCQLVLEPSTGKMCEEGDVSSYPGSSNELDERGNRCSERGGRKRSKTVHCLIM